MLRIITPRLELAASEPGIAQAEADGLHGWCAPLGVDPPESWPPLLNDATTMRWFASAAAQDPDSAGWYSWYVLRRTPRALAGHAGFKGRPDRHGSVEIGYSLLPAFQRRGYGTELVRHLTDWAFGHETVARVMADTYPEFVASVRVLESNGFTLVGRAGDPCAIRYELRRTMFEVQRRPADDRA